jgi:hypothetical protein
MSNVYSPITNTPAFQLLAILAGAFATAGAGLLLTGSIFIGLVAIAFAILLFVLGVKWPSVSENKGRWLVQLVENIARFRKPVFVGIVAIALIYGVHFVYGIRDDLNKYVMPRTVTATQASDLREYLSHHEKFPVTVKTNPLDAEAIQYAGQIFNAFKGAEWDAIFDTGTIDEPLPHNDGLCLNVTGQNFTDPKRNPGKDILVAALQAANITVDCKGGGAGGVYRLFLLVGHRPLVIGDQEPVLSKIGRWIASLSR